MHYTQHEPNVVGLQAWEIVCHWEEVGGEGGRKGEGYIYIQGVQKKTVPFPPNNYSLLHDGR